MSRASRLARRSQAEQRHVEEFVAQRLAAIRMAGGDVRTLPSALLTVGAYLVAGMDGPSESNTYVGSPSTVGQ